MLQDPKILSAVSKIVQRSERQEDLQRLLGTYVDVGLLSQLDNTNHQVFYGRRGTGKTHVMRVLEAQLQRDRGNTIVYIDCRVLGSTSQFSDDSLPLHKRCLALFRDILLAIYHGLLEHIIEHPSPRAVEAMAEADVLANLITEPVTLLTPERIRSEVNAQSGGEAGTRVTAGLKPTGPTGMLSSNVKVTQSQGAAQHTEFSVQTSDKVIFPELQRSLRTVLSLAGARLYVLIDEWSSLPAEVQPFLAEFLKRGLLPLPSATAKISALEYRCHFSARHGDSLVGFELGADIATAPDLDDYFVFDRNPAHITDVYADVLRRHLSTDLPENYLRDQYAISSGAQFASRLFTERATCAELARAAEGVMRDLINIFTQACFHAHRRGRDSIDKKAVLDSARMWFEQDKAQHLDDHLQDVLRRIVDEVIGRRKARSFLLPRALERHPVIQRLFDARVLHHMQRGYADKDNPGVRYNIYAIDYGAYVDLIGTSKQPELGLVENDGGPELVVPFDDKRSIRRIVLDDRFLVAPGHHSALLQGASSSPALGPRS
jgi:hypothetical protein